jgi:Putative amidase domain
MVSPGTALRADRRRPARLTALGPGDVRALQSAVGNRALSRLVESDARQPSSGRRRLLLRYSRANAAAYAKQWAKKVNPAYGRIEPNDCTNFVSQALIAGGWTMVGGSCDDRRSDQAWWFGPRDCRWVGGRPWTTQVKASFTWGGAQNLYNHMQAMQRGTAVGSPMDLEPGDILQMDMGAGQWNAGRIGHSMVVTGKTDDDLLLTYHEPSKLDEPFSAIARRYPGARWYPWQPNTRTPPPQARTIYPGHSIVCPACHDRDDRPPDLRDFDFEGSGLLRDQPQLDEEALRRWLEEPQTPTR